MKWKFQSIRGHPNWNKNQVSVKVTIDPRRIPGRNLPNYAVLRQVISWIKKPACWIERAVINHVNLIGRGVDSSVSMRPFRILWHKSNRKTNALIEQQKCDFVFNNSTASTHIISIDKFIKFFLYFSSFYKNQSF